MSTRPITLSGAKSSLGAGLPSVSSWPREPAVSGHVFKHTLLQEKGDSGCRRTGELSASQRDCHEDGLDVHKSWEQGSFEGPQESLQFHIRKNASNFLLTFVSPAVTRGHDELTYLMK